MAAVLSPIRHFRPHSRASSVDSSSSHMEISSRDAVQRWNGLTREATDWNSLRRDPEIFFPSGNCLIYLYTQGASKRGPSFRMPYDFLLYSSCRPLIEQALLSSVQNPLYHPGSDTPPSYENLGDVSATEHTYLSLYLDTPVGLARDEVFKYHVTTRNFFAWLIGAPLVGTDPVSALLDLKVRMDAWRDPGADNFGALYQYVKEQGYGDFEDIELEMGRQLEGRQLNESAPQPYTHSTQPPTLEPPSLKQRPKQKEKEDKKKDKKKDKSKEKEEKRGRSLSLGQRIKRKFSRNREADRASDVNPADSPPLPVTTQAASSASRMNPGMADNLTASPTEMNTLMPLSRRPDSIRSRPETGARSQAGSRPSTANGPVSVAPGNIVDLVPVTDGESGQPKQAKKRGSLVSLVKRRMSWVAGPLRPEDDDATSTGPPGAGKGPSGPGGPGGGPPKQTIEPYARTLSREQLVSGQGLPFMPDPRAHPLYSAAGPSSASNSKPPSLSIRAYGHGYSGSGSMSGYGSNTSLPLGEGGSVSAPVGQIFGSGSVVGTPTSRHYPVRGSAPPSVAGSTTSLSYIDGEGRERCDCCDRLRRKSSHSIINTGSIGAVGPGGAGPSSIKSRSRAGSVLNSFPPPPVGSQRRTQQQQQAVRPETGTSHGGLNGIRKPETPPDSMPSVADSKGKGKARTSEPRGGRTKTSIFWSRRGSQPSDPHLTTDNPEVKRKKTKETDKSQEKGPSEKEGSPTKRRWSREIRIPGYGQGLAIGKPKVDEIGVAVSPGLASGATSMGDGGRNGEREGYIGHVHLPASAASSSGFSGLPELDFSASNASMNSEPKSPPTPPSFVEFVSAQQSRRASLQSAVSGSGGNSGRGSFYGGVHGLVTLAATAERDDSSRRSMDGLMRDLEVAGIASKGERYGVVGVVGSDDEMARRGMEQRKRFSFEGGMAHGYEAGAWR